MTSYGGNLHSSTTVVISSVEPSSPTVGLLWHNKTNKELRIYDGASFVKVADNVAIALGVI